MKVIPFLIYIPSCVVLCTMLSTYSHFHFALAIVIGLVLGALAFYYRIRPQYLHLGPAFFLSAMLTGLTAIALANLFRNEWIVGPGILRLFSRFGGDAEASFGVLSILLSILTLPSLYTAVSYILKSLIYILRSIPWKQFFGALHTCMHGFPKAAALYVCTVAVSAVIGVGLLFGVYCIPSGNILNNAVSSAATLREEGFDPSMYSWSYSVKDSWTDALILSEAVDDVPHTPMERAMLVYHGYLPLQGTYDSFVKHYLDGDTYADYGTYARYWHGFVVTLRPLFTFMDLQGIYILNGFLLTALCIWICLRLKRLKLSYLIVPYLISCLVLMPLMSMTVLQYATCSYVFILGTIGILLLSDKTLPKWAPFVFLLTGILTAYFDFLTYPIATFGIPAIFCVARCRDSHFTEKLVQMVKNGVSWVFGYAAMWFSKWLLASLLTSENVILDAISAMHLRSSTETNDIRISLLGCLLENFRRFLATPFTLLVIGFAAMCFLRIRKENNRTWKQTMIPYCILAFAPVVWYTALRNHSSIHSFFTNKACIVSIMALLCGLAEGAHRSVSDNF